MPPKSAIPTLWRSTYIRKEHLKINIQIIQYTNQQENRSVLERSKSSEHRKRAMFPFETMSHD